MLIWPQMSHIRPFTYKYHTKIASCLLRLLRGHFLIDLISLQNQGFPTLGSGLSTTLRVVELFLLQKCILFARTPCSLIQDKRNQEINPSNFYLAIAVLSSLSAIFHSCMIMSNK